jgi:glutamyl-tRNA synthetase
VLVRSVTAVDPHHKNNCQVVNNPSKPPHFTAMKDEEVSSLATALASPDFKAIEPHLLKLDKHLTLRSYIDGYIISEADKNIWVALRSNKITNAFLKRGTVANVSRWFAFVEESHPEIQVEIKVQDDAVKAKKAALSKAGASYNIALQDVEKGVVTRFPPEPSYDPSNINLT